MIEPIKKVVVPAVFMALTFAATMIVKIPSPTGGYTNLGDCIILLAAFLLGPVYGMVAGGLGAALADLLSGYTSWAPGTLIIKAIVALVASLVFGMLKKNIHPVWALIIGGISGEFFMVTGYFAYNGLVLGAGIGAAASIPGDMFQAAVGIIVSVLLYTRLVKIPYVRRFLRKDELNGK